MPVVCLRAADLGLTGYEEPAEIEANAAAVRAGRARSASRSGPLMNLGDVTSKTVPKMSLSRARRARRRPVDADLHPAPGARGHRRPRRRVGRDRVPAARLGRQRGVGREDSRGAVARHDRHRAPYRLLQRVDCARVSSADGSWSVTSSALLRTGPAAHARRGLRARSRLGDHHDHRLPRPLHDRARAPTTSGAQAQLAAFNAGEPRPAYPVDLATTRSARPSRRTSCGCCASAAPT